MIRVLSAVHEQTAGFGLQQRSGDALDVLEQLMMS
jgi:hypothetical protein